MKNIVFILGILNFGHITHAQSDQLTSPQIFLLGSIDQFQNVLGLNTIEYLVINNNNIPFTISAREHWIFKAKIDEKEFYFSQGEVIDFDIRAVIMQPNDSLRLIANLNLFDLLKQYTYSTGKAINSATKISVQCCIFGGSQIQDTYYSKEIAITVLPLEKADQEAFEYIKSMGYSPYDLTSRGKITTFGIHKDLSDTLIIKYPESTFAQLAELSQAYINFPKFKNDLQGMSEISQILENPLKSKYSFVRLLAEELKKQI